MPGHGMENVVVGIMNVTVIFVLVEINRLASDLRLIRIVSNDNILFDFRDVYLSSSFQIETNLNALYGLCLPAT